MELLKICGALAAGEYLASFVPEFAFAWPIAALAALLTASLSHGLGFRVGRLLSVLFLGGTLFLGASVGREREFREKPWLRTHRANRRQAVRAGWVAAIRTDFLRRSSIGIGCDNEAVALNHAILLGERVRLPRATWRTFVASGSMHVFAVSGLHVAAVVQTLVMLLMAVGLPHRLAGATALPFLWGYVRLVGDSPSTIRAAVMATAYFLAPVFWRRPDVLRAWALAFLAIHLARPLMIVDVGSVLSFVVMLAIVLVVRLARGWPRWAAGAAVSLAAWMAGVPISAHVFGRVTPGGVFANIVMIAGATCSVVTGVLGIAASFVSCALAAHLNNLTALVMRAMVGVSAFVARLPGSNFDVGRWPLAWCVAWYAFMVLAVVFLHRIRSRRALG